MSPNATAALAFLRAAYVPDHEACARLLGGSYTLSDRALGHVYRTAEELQESIREDAAWADRELGVERVMETSDGTVVVQATMTGTHAGLWRGLSATGKRVVMPVCYIFDFDSEGGIIGEDKYEDHFAVALRLGVVTLPDA
jgi:predicted ester cyclase